MAKKSYIMVPVEDITEDMIKESTCSRPKNLKFCNDGSVAILGFSVYYPNSAKGLTKYTHEEILDILQGPDWISEV